MQVVLNALVAGARFAGDICPRPLRIHGLTRGRGSGEAETDPFARGQGSGESENDPFARGQGSGESEFCSIVRRPRANLLLGRLWAKSLHTCWIICRGSVFCW